MHKEQKDQIHTENNDYIQSLKQDIKNGRFTTS